MCKHLESKDHKGENRSVSYAKSKPRLGGGRLAQEEVSVQRTFCIPLA